MPGIHGPIGVFYKWVDTYKSQEYKLPEMFGFGPSGNSATGETKKKGMVKSIRFAESRRKLPCIRRPRRLLPARRHEGMVSKRSFGLPKSQMYSYVESYQPCQVSLSLPELCPMFLKCQLVVGVAIFCLQVRNFHHWR